MQNWLKRSYQIMIIAPRGPLFVAIQFASLTIAIVSCVVSIYSGVVWVTIANAPLVALWFMIEVDRGAYQRKLQDKLFERSIISKHSNTRLICAIG